MSLSILYRDVLVSSPANSSIGFSIANSGMGFPRLTTKTDLGDTSTFSSEVRTEISPKRSKRANPKNKTSDRKEAKKYLKKLFKA
ncbi:MAG: hypothetical protein RL131_497 [Bacteroidota bacterium]|jgi:hypothetical protein